MSTTISLTLAAFVSGFIGNELGHFTKKIERKLFGRLAIGAFSGFGAALILLIVRSRIETYEHILAIGCGLIFGFLMSNGKAFEGIN